MQLKFWHERRARVISNNRLESDKTMIALPNTSVTYVQRQAFLARVATLCAILVLLVISFSAYLREARVGLGCAAWPQCYGQQLRQEQQGIAPVTHDSPATTVIRLLHRGAAVAVLVMVLLMAWICFLQPPPLWKEGGLALGLLCITLALAVLGRWSASARVPAVAIGNLLGGLALLALCWRLRRQTTLQARQGRGRTGNPALRVLCIALLSAQIALGGLVSAGYAGLSCTALPACGETAAPGAALEGLNPWREPAFVSQDSSLNPAGVAPHMAHRIGALVVFVALLLLGYRAWQGGRRRWALLLLTLLAMEIGAGALMIVFGLPLWMALAHNLFASLLLALVAAD